MNSLLLMDLLFVESALLLVLVLVLVLLLLVLVLVLVLLSVLLLLVSLILSVLSGGLHPYPLLRPNRSIPLRLFFRLYYWKRRWKKASFLSITA